MDNQENKGGQFSYTYSGAEQAEIQRIREKYSADKKTEEGKLDRLRRLDASVYGTAQAIAISIGVIGTLVMGFGMSLVMSELSSALGLGAVAALALGILFGILGGGLVALAYPVYSFVLNRKRSRIAPEILALTEELLGKPD